MALNRQQIPGCPQDLQDQRPNQYKAPPDDQKQQQEHFEREASSLKGHVCSDLRRHYIHD
jgi:hypothetical protein